jgi:hypothetical protein
MTLDLEVNEVEVKGLTSLASVTEITGFQPLSSDFSFSHDFSFRYDGREGGR